MKRAPRSATVDRAHHRSKAAIRSLAALIIGGMLIAATARMADAIGFIDSPSATCRKVKGNQCAISW